MHTKQYRGIPLPDKCTRKTLREIKKRLSTKLDGESGFICISYATLTSRIESYVYTAPQSVIDNYWQQHKEWGLFLEKLGFDISGGGFRIESIPEWFKQNLIDQGYDILSFESNKFRYVLIRDILWSCFKE